MGKDIVDFKTVSPLFEMERDGVKPFTTQQLDFDDPRREHLWPHLHDYPIIRITNPATGESFERQVTHVTGLT